MVGSYPFSEFRMITSIGEVGIARGPVMMMRGDHGRRGIGSGVINGALIHCFAT